MKTINGIAGIAGLAALMAFAAAPSMAQTTDSVMLSGANETLPTDSPGTGFGSVTVSGGTLTYTLDLYNFVDPASGTEDPITMVHIHDAAPGMNGPIEFTIFDSSTLQPVNGMYPTLDGSGTASSPLVLTGSFNFVSADKTTAQLLSDYDAGDFYFNVHTMDYDTGASRGQIDVAPAPEMSSFAGFGAGAAVLGLAFLGARRRKSNVA